MTDFTLLLIILTGGFACGIGAVVMNRPWNPRCPLCGVRNRCSVGVDDGFFCASCNTYSSGSNHAKRKTK